jgi:hypothetical protein
LMSFGVSPVSIQFLKAGTLLVGRPTSIKPKLPGVLRDVAGSHGPSG